MTNNGLTKEEAGLRRAALAGVVSGLRSMAQLAMLARSIDAGEISPPAGPFGRLFGSPQARQAIQLAAVVESIFDKLPILPSRLKPAPFLGRLGLGAVSAAALAQTQQTPVAPAAIRGVAGAAIGSVGGYLFRVTAGRLTGLPNLVVALAEDAIAIGLARSAIRPESLSDLAAEQAEQTDQEVQTASPTPATSPTPSAPPTTVQTPILTPEPPTPDTDDPTTAFPDAGEAGTETPTAPPPST